MAPATIGRYHIASEIAAGGFGVVYRATDPVLHRDVAIKVLHPHLAGNPQLRERFVGEGRALARVHHPNLVQIHDAGESDGQAYLAMEFIAGQSLADIAGNRPVPLAELAPIIQQVAGALDAIHAARLVHRDIKPANIMLTDTGRAVLLDLGIARTLDQPGLTANSMIVGTPSYLAPEQVDGTTPVSPATDVYQLGATVYALLSGQPPYDGDTAQIHLAIISKAPPDLLTRCPDLPLPVVAAVMQAMAKYPAYRPASAGEFAAALLPWTSTADGRALAQRAPAVTVPPRSPTSEHAPLAGSIPVARPVSGGAGITSRRPVGTRPRPRWLGVAITLAAAAVLLGGVGVVLLRRSNAAPSSASVDTNTGTTTATATVASAASVWAGTWDTSYGPMTLTESGSAVTGTYEFRAGRITGQIEGNRLIGIWAQAPSYQPPNEAGEFEFTLAADGRSWSGRWRYSRGASWYDDWVGRR